VRRPAPNRPGVRRPNAARRADVARVHADIDALTEFHGALARFRHAQREVAERGDHQIEVTRAALEARAGRWRSRLDQGLMELAACQRRATQTAAAGSGPVDCSPYARAVSEAEDWLERIRRWQYRVDQESSEFLGIAGAFRSLLDNDLPRIEDHVLAIVASLERVRRVQAAGP
jgi:hypothetical protein